MVLYYDAEHYIINYLGYQTIHSAFSDNSDPGMPSGRWHSKYQLKISDKGTVVIELKGFSTGRKINDKWEFIVDRIFISALDANSKIIPDLGIQQVNELPKYQSELASIVQEFYIYLES